MPLIDLGKVAILGDSLSLMNFKGKPVTTPGSCLAFLFAGAGHQVLVEAIGGFALQYFGPGAARTKQGMQAAKMIERIKAYGPDTLLVCLGMNDYADSQKALSAGILAIIHAFSGPGVQPRLIFVGPPAVSPKAKGGTVAQGLSRVYAALLQAPRPVIDTRLISGDLIEPPLRAGDYIHFSKKGAELYAGRLFKVLEGRRNPRSGGALRNVGIYEVLTIAAVIDLLWGGPLTNLLWGKHGRR